jgi:hypothetical protein
VLDSGLRQSLPLFSEDVVTLRPPESRNFGCIDQCAAPVSALDDGRWLMDGEQH